MKLAKTITVIFLAVVLTAAAASAQAVKHVDANGMSFAYIEVGSGPPLVLVHGSVFDYRAWSKQIKALARHYRVIAYSRRYHWPNAQPGANADSSFEVQVEDLAAIIKALKLGPVHLVGQSLGGAVSLHLALRHPELVRSLFLADPGVGNLMLKTPEDEVEWQKRRQPQIRDPFESGNPEEIVRKYAADVAPGVLEKATAEVRQMLLENVPAFRMDYTARRLPFTCEIAAKITAPALVVSGDQSPLHGIAEKTATCLKNARFVSIPKATHWIPHDQPQKFNEALLGFLAQYKPPVESSADRKKINDIVQKWQDEWNRHDIKALANLLAEEADVVAASGIRLRSRKEFEENDTKSHAGVLKESIWTNHIVEVKFIRSDIAIVHGEWSISGVRERDGAIRPPQKGIFTWMLEKRKESWSIIAVQNTFVR